MSVRRVYGVRRRLAHWAMVGSAMCRVRPGISERTIRRGIEELSSIRDPLESGRQRRPGGGRKSSEQHLPGVVNALNDLVEGTTRGDPVRPLLWTCKSTRTLAQELGRMGYSITAPTSANCFTTLATAFSQPKTREGSDHPDRDAQFD